jgi:hypothetical protein
MNWIYWTFLGAAILHILEEYVFPGGFLTFMQQSVPRFAHQITAHFSLLINGLFLSLCLLAVVLGPGQPIFGLSVAWLLFFNGAIHILTSWRWRAYTPGLISSLVLYLPLSIIGLGLISTKGTIDFGGIATAVLLGIFYQLVPISYLALTS